MLDADDDATSLRARDAWLSVILIAAIAVFVGADLVEDYFSGLTFHHFLIHVAMLTLAITHGLHLWKRLRAERTAAGELNRDLESARQEIERWRREAGDAIASFGTALNRQLARWQLTDAERDVALLLLRGLSHKEVAAARNTSERTVRQQALSLYRKSGLGGRNALAAFFLQDLMARPVTGAAENGGGQAPALQAQVRG